MRNVVLAALIVFTACGGRPDAPSALPEGATPAQVEAFQALVDGTGARWSWAQDAARRSPSHLAVERRATGRVVLAPGADAASATIAFVGTYRDLFAMKDPASELRVDRVEVDDLGMTHARLRQVSHGIPIVGGELAAHYDAQGRITSIDANVTPDLDGIDLTPRIDPLATRDRLKEEASAHGADPSRVEANDGDLVVFTAPNVARLAFRYTVRAVDGPEPAIWVTTVDARTGDVLDRYDDLQTVLGSAAGVLGDTKQVEVTANGGGYVMTDTSNGATVRTYTAATAQVTPGTLVSSNNLNAWDTGVAGAGAAVDAHVYAGVVLKYYKDKHARNAIDGVGGAMTSTAHFGTAYENAFWDGVGMSYGDGGTRFRALSAGLDVVAHEFTHGVTQRTSNLVYQGQPGALNEAVSDIFGAFIEHVAKPDAANNWVIGEAIARTAGLSRDFRNPAVANQPAHMSNYRQTQQDNGGVHINSGIVNNAAYLMTVGGRNPVSNVEVRFGIGWEKSERLWYRANTRYFITTTTFAQAAQNVNEAAKDLGFTTNEQNIVDCAWKAVGIAQGACATLLDPTAPAPAAAPAGETAGPVTEDLMDGTAAPGAPSGGAAPNARRPAFRSDDASCGVAGVGRAADGAWALAAGLFVLAIAARRRRR